MFQNYVTVALRSLTKNPVYSLINILGLAIGMAACLMILLYVRYELSFDRWLPNAANSYQLQSWYHGRETGEPFELQMAPYVAGPTLAKDFPQVEKTAYVFQTEPVLIQNGEAQALKDWLYTEGDLLDVLRLPLVRGDARALSRPGEAVMTQAEARRIFGTEDVVGRTLTVISRGKNWTFKITGVLKDIPKNSHLKATTIARINYTTFNFDTPRAYSCWGCQNGWVYAKLKPGADAKAMEAGFAAWEKRNIPDEDIGEAHYNAGDDQDFRLVNVADIHLGKAQQATLTPGNDRGTIVTFAVIALLILGMAAVNYTNLATARASQRAREVALRKVLGATRRQLIVQFLGESIVVAVIAMVIALAIVELAMPSFAAFLKADIGVRYFGSGGIAVPMLLLVATVGLAGGLYPAFFISRFHPATVLKANKSSSETPGSGRLRQALVVAQFAISIGLIICTAVVYGQTVYARSVDPGYNRSNILQVEELSRYQLIGRGKQIADRIRRVPGVVAVGRTNIGVATDNNSETGVMLPGQTKPISIDDYSVDTGFKDAMGLKLIAGRWFDPARPMDVFDRPYPPNPALEAALARRGALAVANVLATKRLGFRNPEDAVGKTFRTAFLPPEAGLAPVTIIGVVQDSRFRSIRQPVDPIFFTNSDAGPHSQMIVRFTGDPAAVRAQVEQAWRGMITDVPFNAKFSDEIVGELYDAEDARAKTFAAFAGLAVIVACLGLFGLASFTAERRTKEIGIRKVLGARTRDIVRLLVWQFNRPVLIANLIAWPIAFWLMRDWLNGFDARIGLSPAYFVAAGAAAVLIASVTVMGHAWRVARASPIHALRYE